MQLRPRQGGSPEKRYLEHASLPFVGAAYESLRNSGIPRDRIITICQLDDTLRVLRAGAQGNLSNQIPAAAYQFQLDRTTTNCSRLIEEGGADYDGELVNPGTVWHVLLGSEQDPENLFSKIVPEDASAIFFAIYSHGDSHPSTSRSKELKDEANTVSNEWFCHFPYQSDNEKIYESVATEFARGNPKTYLYATQLKMVFARLFGARPRRPVVGLLNYCRSGGAVEFLGRPAASAVYGASQWPLYLMASAKPGEDALVGGLWQAWFEQIAMCLNNEESNPTLEQFWMDVLAEYRMKNRYDVLNFVQYNIYPDLGDDVIGTTRDSFSRKLYPLLSVGKEGLPDWGKIEQLQVSYEKRGIQFYVSRPGLTLISAVRNAIEKATQPLVLYGAESRIQEASVKELFGTSCRDDESMGQVNEQQLPGDTLGHQERGGSSHINSLSRRKRPKKRNCP
eukprot:CAMPEP_0206368690 /NCGR_PEP_ID=MMETSP0294-20121207/4820_1 /ASSEMBLY_ACC=CAM_ASM_000327 /TAXON_ID=39354 /ORGANISM="Heterosigma akashiwo, Strain CCMP2393" /LENGTH=450 /DNA_ID=CAMNT_0053815239 /DNA_START=175 /DNA_END=1527 /DNA_ORIENTATION=+